MKNQLIIGLVTVAFVVLFTTSCYYDEVLPVTIEVTEDVSFSADIIPVFDANCSISGCHSTGGEEPDLTATNAFSQLNEHNLINTGNPEASELYQWMIGNEDLVMPPSGSNATNNALVLAWIKQGALDN